MSQKNSKIDPNLLAAQQIMTKEQVSLRQHSERYRLLVSNVRDYAIFLLDPNGIILTWNAGAESLKGYKPHEVIGLHFSKFYTQDDLDHNHPQFELEEARVKGRYEEEGWRVRKDGTKFWANIIITALRDSSGELHGFSKITRDITERKRAEDKLKMAHENLERRVIERTKELQKAVEARDEFLLIASHELRTPLTVLKLQHQLFERQIARTKEGIISAEKATEVSEMTVRQVNQLLRLVEDMLDVSRISTGRLKIQPEQGNFSDLVADVFESFKAQFQASGIQANLKVEEGLMASFDSQRMEQVIANLISNAIKYGGHSPIEVSAQKRGVRIEVSVSDKGQGIPEPDQKRIFERFERAVNASEASGLGLGLFISHQIIEAHGGIISVESRPFKETRFTFLIP